MRTVEGEIDQQDNQARRRKSVVAEEGQRQHGIHPPCLDSEEHGFRND